MRLRNVLLALLASTALVASASATPVPLPSGSIRLAGGDRYATAAAISNASFAPPVESVFIASGLDYPDALSAGPAAALSDSPVLLVGKGTLNAHTKNELQRLNPQKIIIAGGQGAVGADVAAELATYGEVTRWEGPDRYATAATISARSWVGSSPVVVLASGETFADALSGGPAAAQTDAPMLLARNASLPDSTRNELVRLKPSQVYLLGGTGAISSAVEAAVKTATGATVTRVSGADRYETSAAVARQFWPGGASTMFFATGLAFPDAVSGTPAAAVNSAPIVLTRLDCMPRAVAQLKRDMNPTTTAILGGTGVVASSGATTECVVPGQYYGSGDDVIPITKPGGAGSVAVATISYAGPSNFIVIGLDNRLEWQDLLVNEIGSYSGTVLIPSTVTQLDITASGPWTVHVKAMSTVRSFGSGTITGQGDEVVQWTGGNRTVRMNHSGGSNFIVLGIDAQGEWDDLYVNEIGAYSGTQVVRSTSRWLTITADGPWTMTVQ